MSPFAPKSMLFSGRTNNGPGGEKQYRGHLMNPQMTTYFMAEQIRREGFNRQAARRSLAHEAAGINHRSVVGNLKSAVANVATAFMSPKTAPSPAASFGRDAADCCA
jgi:hypothetical protein